MAVAKFDAPVVVGGRGVAVIARVERLLGVSCVLASLATIGARAADPPTLTRFLEAASPDDRTARAALDELAAAWKDAYAAMIIDLARQLRPSRPGIRESNEPTLVLDDERGATSQERRSIDDVPELRDAGSPIRRRLIAFLERQTKQRFGDDLNRWREWMWKLPYDPHPDYVTFKGLVYGQIDARMRAFFPAGARSSIRLDEIDWGGVAVNGIPPLRYPRVLSAISTADGDQVITRRGGGLLRPVSYCGCAVRSARQSSAAETLIAERRTVARNPAEGSRVR